MEQKIKITQTSNADMNIGVPKKLTALDMYIDEINKSCREYGIHFQLYKEGKEYEQSKKMEKEQIMMAFNDGIVNKVFNKKNSEQYYNEIYNKITITETKKSIEGIGLNNNDV